MSDLQISLLAIGACVIALVYLFNWWQERAFRRRAEAAFAREHDDVLLQDKSPSPAASATRLEPRLDAEVALDDVPAAGERPSAVFAEAVTIDPIVDFVLEVAMSQPAAVDDLCDELKTFTTAWSKPLLLAAFDAAGGQWHSVPHGSGAACARWRCAVQLANRAGCLTQPQMVEFRDAVADWAGRHGAQASCMDIAKAHAIALELDRFCADVDIAVGVNVVTHDGGPFSGTNLRGLAEAAGMRLEGDGRFCLRDEQGELLFSLDNHEPMPFVAEQIKTMFTTGVTFLLDVPRVSDAAAAFERMLETARNLATALGGRLVDDNRTALSSAAIDKIRQQLTGILARMEAGQIPAGGARARRLFS